MKLRKRSVAEINRRFNWASLTTKAAIFTILTCSIPILIVGFLFANQTITTVTEAAVEKNNKVAERVASDIGLFLMTKKNFLLALSKKEELQAMIPGTTKQYITQIQPFYGSADPLFVADATGAQISRSDGVQLVNISEQDYFKEALQKTASFSSPVQSKDTNKLSIMGAFPIYSANNKIIGVIGASLSIENLQNLIEQILSQNPGYSITVLDKDTIPLYNQFNSSSVENRTALPEPFYEEAAKNKTGHTIASLRGQDFLVSYRPIPNTDWVVVSHYSKEAAVDSTNSLIERSIKLALLITAVFVSIGLFVTQWALKPLQGLIACSNQVAQGDLTILLSNKRNDELGSLANAFNNMIAKLRDIVNEVKHTSSYTASSADQIASSADQSSSASQYVAHSINNVAEQITQQSSETSAAQSLIRELLSISSSVSRNADRVASATNNCSTIASQGQTIVNQTVDQIQKMKPEIESTLAKVSFLGEKANEINQITESISTITKQTNLLALNAAIEAARAGEAGKGFAIVANEVKKLADESANSVKSIAKIITEIQSQTTEAITGVQLSFNYMEQSAETAANLGTTFAQIVNAIGQAKELADSITQDAHSQVQACDQALGAVANISVLASQNNSVMSDISVACEEQAASAQEIASATAELKIIAHNLQAMVDHFKS